jgi:hypothetical protein
MGNTVCQKCGINIEYYRIHKNKFQIRKSCRYHTEGSTTSNNKKNHYMLDDCLDCLDCTNILHRNCYHKWKYSLCR